MQRITWRNTRYRTRKLPNTCDPDKNLIHRFAEKLEVNLITAKRDRLTSRKRSSPRRFLLVCLGKIGFSDAKPFIFPACVSLICRSFRELLREINFRMFGKHCQSQRFPWQTATVIFHLEFLETIQTNISEASYSFQLRFSCFFRFSCALVSRITMIVCSSISCRTFRRARSIPSMWSTSCEIPMQKSSTWHNSLWLCNHSASCQKTKRCTWDWRSGSIMSST